MKDSLSEMEFLIDSGSTVSIIPLSYVDNDEPATSRNLFALNQTEVKTYGKRNLTIDIGLSQKEMKWNFIVADTATAIIGADFLSYYKLAIDVGAKRLLETEKRNVLELAEPKSEVSHKPPCQALIAKEQCVNAEVYKQMVINDFRPYCFSNHPLISQMIFVTSSKLTVNPSEAKFAG